MLAKKNQKYDFRKNSTLFFSLGLLCMTIISYFAIELELENIKFSDVINVKPVNEFVEEPIHYMPKPQEFTPIKQNDFVNEYTIVTKDPEPIDTKPIVNVPTPSSDTPTTSSPFTSDNLPEYLEPEVEPEKVDFISLEDTPIFPGCENLTKAERDICFREKILNHIKKNLRYPEYAIENDLQDRIQIQFIIEKDGSISIANLRGQYETLNKEATRVIKSLPKIKSGEQRKKPVRVSYIIPITFRN
jgi:protein TonB